MRASQSTATLIGAIGLVLLIGAGCSQSTQNTGMDSTLTPKAVPQTVKNSVPPAPTRPGPKVVDASSGSSGSSGTAAGGSSVTAPHDGPSPTFPSLSNIEPGESLAVSKSAGEQVIPPTDIVVAKADAADAARRRAEDMQRDQLASAAAGLEDVFFAFDSATLTAEAKQALMLDSEWMKANPDKPVLIEGHCDERGAFTYNLVLGEKRAKSVQKFLIDLGVPANRVAVVSYGKERPFCKEHDEACYQKNRRGHIVLRTN